ncbi:MAG: hypothetical protein D6772_01560 [Bacteroidetes bacterium]|nr:MAG: hypothetical protein D6772_01560 [Bacteroidota bacterium]
MLDIFRNICSVSILTFIGQVKLVSMKTYKLLILPIFIDTNQNRHVLLIHESNSLISFLNTKSAAISQRMAATKVVHY